MRPRSTTPFFLECSRRTAVVCWTAIVGTGALVVAFTAWLVAEAPDHLGPWWLLPLSLLAGIYCADIASGVFHWTMDTWFDEDARFDRAVRIAREHHSHPSHILGYPFRDYVGFTAFPAMVTVGPVALALVVFAPRSAQLFHSVVVSTVVLAGMWLASHTHALGHHWSRRPLVRRMQRAHLVVSPEHHMVHHSGGHDVRYCVFNGWANPLLDRLDVWRRAEAGVTALTGARPREHDREWMARYGRDGGRRPGGAAAVGTRTAAAAG